MAAFIATPCTSTSSASSSKRQHPEDSSDHPYKVSRTVNRYFYKLESESELSSDEDTESINSIQEKSTDFAKDTSDISGSDDDVDSIIVIGGSQPSPVEYEPVTCSEEEHPFTRSGILSSSESDAPVIENEGSNLEVILKDIEAQDSDTFADSSSLSSETGPGMDPELSLTDYWSCVQCKASNNNPMFRFCEKCFKVRKTFFPPRPKAKKFKKRMRRRRGKTNSSPVQISEPSQQVNSQDLNSSTCSTVKLGLSQVRLSSDQDDSSSINNSSRNLHNSSSQLCETCLTRPKDGVFVHGHKIGHMFCCYQCSKKVWRKTGRCPICNCRASQVLKIVS